MVASRNGERTMNLKKAIVLASIAALALPALPANAATTGSVTVQWNTQAVGSLTIVTQYDGTTLGTHKTTAETIYKAGSAASSCTASDTEATSGTVNFGNVTPDQATTQTNCLELNAIDAQVSTNDTAGWTVSQQVTATPASATYFGLCAYGNGASLPFANSATLAATASTRSAAVTEASVSACSGQFIPVTPTAAVNMNVLNTNAFSSASPAHLGEDLELMIAPNAPKGASSETVTYTLTLN